MNNGSLMDNKQFRIQYNNVKQNHDTKLTTED